MSLPKKKSNKKKIINPYKNLNRFRFFKIPKPGKEKKQNMERVLRLYKKTRRFYTTHRNMIKVIRKSYYDDSHLTEPKYIPPRLKRYTKLKKVLIKRKKKFSKRKLMQKNMIPIYNFRRSQYYLKQNILDSVKNFRDNHQKRSYNFKKKKDLKNKIKLGELQIIQNNEYFKNLLNVKKSNIFETFLITNNQ